MISWIVSKNLSRQNTNERRFYSFLNDEHIKDEEYEHAKNV